MSLHVVTHLNGEVYRPGDTITIANGSASDGTYKVIRVIDERTVEIDGPNIPLKEYSDLNKQLKLVSDPRIPEDYGILTMTTLTDAEIAELHELVKSQSVTATQVVLSTGARCVYLGRKLGERKKNFQRQQAIRKAKASW